MYWVLSPACSHPGVEDRMQKIERIKTECRKTQRRRRYGIENVALDNQVKENITSTFWLIYIQSFYLCAILGKVFYVQVFYILSSALSLSSQSHSTFRRTILSREPAPQNPCSWPCRPRKRTREAHYMELVVFYRTTFSFKYFRFREEKSFPATGCKCLQFFFDVEKNFE